MNHQTETHLEREIRAQPEVLARRLAPGRGAAERAAAVLREADVAQIVIAARGSSDNAARYAQYLFGLEARLPVALATPWLYGEEHPPLLRGAGVIAISQSGQSPDIVAVARTAREQHRPTVAITNDVDSPLAAAVDVVVPMLAGPERSVAATKTYLASLHALAQISEALHPDPERTAWFERLPERLRAWVDDQLDDRDRFDPLARASAVTVVGRGLQFSTAFETALKIRELSGIPAEAFSLPDLLHGPVAALPRGGALWQLGIGGRRQPDAAAFAALGRASAAAVAVSDDPEVLALADIPVAIDSDLPQWLGPLFAVVPGQAAALRLAELRGVDIDRPPGLTKVTLTR